MHAHPAMHADFESADAESSPSSSSGGGSSSASASPSSYTPSAFSISNNGGPAPTPSPTPSSTPTPPPSVTAQATTSDAASSTTAAPYTSLRGSGSGSSVPNLRKVQYLKSRLVSAVASLDRGLAATVSWGMSARPRLCRFQLLIAIVVAPSLTLRPPLRLPQLLVWGIGLSCSVAQ